MSYSMDGWTWEEIQAAYRAYDAAPDSTTVGELRVLMDRARKEVQAAREMQG